MKESELVLELKNSLNDAAKDAFTSEANDGAFKRHLEYAALDLGRVRPYRLNAELTLEAGVALYDAPADFLRFVYTSWGVGCAVQPWDDNYPGRRPDVRSIYTATGQQLQLVPAPSALQIEVYGAAMPYIYQAGHIISDVDGETTVREGDKGLLILRAQAEAMKEMAARNIKKPVQLRDGLGSSPRNGTPAAVYEQLMKAFESQAMH